MKAIVKRIIINSNEEAKKAGPCGMAEITLSQSFKYFAVTQDIEVGDEIIAISDLHTGGKQICKEIKGNDILIRSVDSTTGGWYNKQGYFKVLGEISPDAAKFVQDGEEYEVEKIRPELQDLNRTRLGNPFDESIYEVKCPTCSSYH